eukprot:5723029-Pyramimonas_sp.AAC.1
MSGSASSESCSRCSDGLISVRPLVPNRAPAAALASLFPVLCHGMVSVVPNRPPNLKNNTPTKSSEVIIRCRFVDFLGRRRPPPP